MVLRYLISYLGSLGFFIFYCFWGIFFPSQTHALLLFPSTTYCLNPKLTLEKNPRAGPPPDKPRPLFGVFFADPTFSSPTCPGET